MLPCEGLSVLPRDQGSPRLPPGYRLDLVGDPCVIVLRRDDGGAWPALPATLTPCMPGRDEESERLPRCPATGARTLPRFTLVYPGGEHEHGRDGEMPGGRGRHHSRGVRDLPGTGLGTVASAGAGGGDGQPFGPQGWAGSRGVVEGMGCELLYLPPYSPDLNPIEGAFAKLKGCLRAAAARSRRPGAARRS
jgi:hypothetical protein